MSTPSERRSCLEAFDRALGREARVLARYPNLTRQQLCNRLDERFERFALPPEQAWVRVVRRYGDLTPTLRVLDGGLLSLDDAGRLLVRVHGTAIDALTGMDMTGSVSNFVEASALPPHRLFALDAPGARAVTIGERNELSVWDIDGTTPSLVVELGPSSATSVGIDRDGRMVAWATEDGLVTLLDLVGEERTVLLPAWGGPEAHIESSGLVVGHCLPASSIAVADDRARLAIADGLGSLEVWEVAEPRLLAQLRGEEPRVSAPHPPLAFSPDGTLIAHGGAGIAVRVWDVATGEEIHRLYGLSTYAEELRFAGDGRSLAAGSTGGNTCVWDVATPSDADHAEHRIGELVLATVSPTGRKIVLGQEGGASVLSLVPTPMSSLQHRDADLPAAPVEMTRWDGQDLIAASFARDDRILAGLTRSGTVYVWDTESGDILAELSEADSGGYLYPDGVAIALGPDAERVACVVDGCMYVFEWRDGPSAIESIPIVGADHPLDLTWSPDGRFVVLLLPDELYALDREESTLLEGADAEPAATMAHGEDRVELLRTFSSLSPLAPCGVHRPSWFDDVARIRTLDGTREVVWPAESPLMDVRYVGDGEHVVAVTLAATVAVLAPVGLAEAPTQPLRPVTTEEDLGCEDLDQSNDLNGRGPEPHRPCDDATVGTEVLVEPRPVPLSESLPRTALPGWTRGNGGRFTFDGERRRVVVEASELGGFATFWTKLPLPMPFGINDVLWNLLRASNEIPYTKGVVSETNDLILACEVPLDGLRPLFVDSLVRGLAALADLSRRDLRRAAEWEDRSERCSLAQARGLEVDAEECFRILRLLAERSHILVDGDGPELTLHTQVGDLPFEVEVAAHPTNRSISFVLPVGFGVKKDDLVQLLSMNRVAHVARVGIDRNMQLLLRYEVPALPRDVLDRVRIAFDELLRLVMATVELQG